MTLRSSRAPVVFGLGLTAAALVALALRLLYGFSLEEPSGDSVFYHRVANEIAEGRGFVNPFLQTATAAHPPLFPLLLSVVSLLGGTGVESHQAAGCALGAATVVVIGFAGRRLAGPGAGLVAAGLAAAYPPLLANDSLLLSESAYGLTVAVVVLLALRVYDRSTLGRALALGAAIGFATLCRPEALLLLPLIVLSLRGRVSGRALAAACVAAVIVVVPWSVRNLVAFDQVVLVSTNDGSVLAGANCPTSYGPLLGQWDLRCALRGGVDPKLRAAEIRALEQALDSGRVSERLIEQLSRAGGRNEAKVASRQRSAGIDYARSHADRLPKVLAARAGRTWSVYGTAEQVRTNTFLRGSPKWLEWLTVACFGVAVLLALAGGYLLRRRGGPLLVLLAPPLVVTVSSVLGYGTPRFRQAAEISIVLLAAVAVSAVVARRGSGAGRTP